jgi:hypothetical protein
MGRVRARSHRCLSIVTGINIVGWMSSEQSLLIIILKQIWGKICYLYGSIQMLTVMGKGEMKLMSIYSVHNYRGEQL